MRAAPLGKEGSAGGGAGLGPPPPPGACRHQNAIPVSPVADAGGAQLSPRLPALQRSSSREVFFGTGPLAPQPDAVARPWDRGRRGQGWPRQRFAFPPEPSIPVALAPVASAWTTVPKNPLERAMDSSLNEGFAGTEQEQPGVRALLLPWVHISRPFQSWFVKLKQAQGQQSCRGFESPYK